jgi:hypothetical protein
MISSELFTAIADAARSPRGATPLGPPPNLAPPPVSQAVFDKYEGQLDIRLPESLRRLYTEVANGHFGPGYGLLSLAPLSPAGCHTLVLQGVRAAMRSRDCFAGPSS